MFNTIMNENGEPLGEMRSIIELVKKFNREIFTRVAMGISFIKNSNGNQMRIE